jgi:hypothetical protein
MEINILLLLLAIHCILPRRRDILGCGIIAFAGRNPARFNKQKFDILGLFNNSRGGDSCGVSTDGEIYYGVTLNRNYEDFIVNGGYMPPVDIPVVIGHTRKASVGVVNENNAHPFGFGDIRDEQGERRFEFVGCHNGTLYNHEELGKKYGVETTIREEEYNHFVRNKVDSEILLEILYKQQNPDVLKEYIGGAAVVFSDLNKPNILYAFHGASKKEVGDKEDNLFEERPLYYYQESKETVYISSMKEALMFIGGEDKVTVHEFSHNTLYIIENGNVSKATRIRVDRTGAGQRKNYTSGFSIGQTSTTTREIEALIEARNRGKKKDRSKTKRRRRLDDVSNIYDETVIQDDFLSSIYYNKLRYWRNGHLVTGIYTFIKDFGFLLLGEDVNTAQNKLYGHLGEYFSLESKCFVDEKAVDTLMLSDTSLFIPFGYSTSEPPVHYFHDGIMLESVHDYNALMASVKKFTFEQMSTMSKYPICKMTKHRHADDKQCILFNEKPVTINIVPVQSKCCYNIEDGNLVSIDKFENEIIKEAEECCSIIPLFDSRGNLLERGNAQLQIPFVIPEALVVPKSDYNRKSGAEEMMKSFKDKKTIEFMDEDAPIETSEDEDEKGIELINKHIMPVYDSMQVVNENLKNEGSDTAQEIIELNKDYMLSIDCIIESKEKENG